jgi:hypothetical protein
MQIGKLSIEPRHAVHVEHLMYHRERFAQH